MKAIRYVASQIVGIFSVFLILELLGSVLPILSGKLVEYASYYLVAAAGGLVSAIVAPSHKLTISFSTGAVFPVTVYWLVLFTEKYSHWDPLSPDIAWFSGIPIAFATGALGVKLFTRAA